MKSLRGNRGLTLLELLVVIVILIVVTGLSLPQIRLPQNLDGTAQKISALIQALYNESRSKNLMYRLHFSVDTGQYWITSLKRSIESPPAKAQFRAHRSLPHDVQFKEIVVSHHGAARGNSVFMQFFPVGRVEPTVIYLMNQQDVLSLLVHPVTGSVQIKKGHYVPRRWKDLSV